MSAHFPHLFESLRIGSKTARNRIMRLATTTNTGENGGATDLTVAVYRRIARGGTGTLVTEAMRAHPSGAGRNSHAMQLYSKDSRASFERLARAVHDEGALLIAQLNHGGRQHHGSGAPNMWAPSAVACPYSGGIPHAMTREEIVDLRNGFVAAAVNAREANFDGVEIHGAQGHLLMEFASPYSNKREDEYGGSVENRLRLACEIISGAREKAGPDFIVGYRMGYEEFTAGGITLEESKYAMQLLLKLGAIDYVSLAQGNFNTLDTHCPDSHYGRLPYIDGQAQLKAIADGVRVVASARIRTPEEAESIIAAGQADLVGMCRALVADPEWPLKANEGRSNDIRICISTSACWGGGGDRRINCSINPTVGNELDPPLSKVADPKRIVVVGGGPAGLEAARVAAERGHHVVLFEKKSTLGGKLVGAERFGGYHDVHHAVDFLTRQASKTGLTMRLGAEASVQTVLAERPDAVILATGASILTPRLEGDGSIPVYSYEGEIPSGMPPGKVVVMDEDGYYWAAALTEALARSGRDVTYVTRFFERLRELPRVTRIPTLRALDELGVIFHEHTCIERAERGDLLIYPHYNRKHQIRIDKTAAVVWLGVQRVNDGLAQSLRDAGIKDVHVVGDAYAPRRLANALGEAHRAGRTV